MEISRFAKKRYIVLIILLVWLVPKGCNYALYKMNEDVHTSKRVIDLIENNKRKSNVTITLKDFKKEGMVSDNFLLKFKVEETIDGEKQTSTTDWIPVNERTYLNFSELLGVQVFKIEDGKKVVDNMPVYRLSFSQYDDE